MATRTGKTRTFTVSFPHELAEQVERVATEEHRTVSELFREMYRVYRTQRSLDALDRLTSAAQSQGNKGYGPDDVYRLLREVREERDAKHTHRTAA